MLYTSTLILLGRLEDPADRPEESVVSAITLAEISAGPHVARTAEERILTLGRPEIGRSCS